MLIRFHRATQSQRGQTSAEYVGMIALVAAVVVFLVLAAPGIGGAIADKIGSLISGTGGTSAAPGSGGNPGGGVPGPAGVPGPGGFDPSNLPGDVLGNPWWKLGTSLFGLATGPRNLRDSIGAIPAWRLYNRIVAPIAAKYGPDEPITLRTYMRWQQLTSQSAPIAPSLKSVGVKVPRQAPPAVCSESSARFSPPSVWPAVSTASPNPLRTMAGAVWATAAAVAGVGAGVVGTLALLGVGAVAAPVIAIPAAIAGIGAAAWGLGNLIVDNWDSISGAAEAAGGWVADRASDAANMVGDAANAAADFAGDAAEAAGDVAGDVADAAGDAVDAAGDVAGDVADAVSFWD